MSEICSSDLRGKKRREWNVFIRVDYFVVENEPLSALHGRVRTQSGSVETVGIGQLYLSPIVILLVISRQIPIQLVFTR